LNSYTQQALVAAVVAEAIVTGTMMIRDHISEMEIVTGNLGGSIKGTRTTLATQLTLGVPSF
jgi:hypothetical protein